jgi:hypothetical protein
MSSTALAYRCRHLSRGSRREGAPQVAAAREGGRRTLLHVLRSESGTRVAAPQKMVRQLGAADGLGALQPLQVLTHSAMRGRRILRMFATSGYASSRQKEMRPASGLHVSTNAVRSARVLPCASALPSSSSAGRPSRLTQNVG